MKLKNITDFITESHTPDYLEVIIKKLKGEGKSDMTIYTYLDLLNISKDRIMQSMQDCDCVAENSIDEGELDDIVDDIDDEAEDEKKDTGKGDDEESDEPADEEDEKDEDDTDKKDAKSKALQDAVADIEMVAKAIKSVKDIAKNVDEST